MLNSIAWKKFIRLKCTIVKKTSYPLTQAYLMVNLTKGLTDE